jgi:hypothetical protein
MSAEQRSELALTPRHVPLAEIDVHMLRALSVRTKQALVRRGRNLSEEGRAQLTERVAAYDAELTRRGEEVPPLPAPRRRRRSPRPNPLIPKATPPDGLLAALEASLQALRSR